MKDGWCGTEDISTTEKYSSYELGEVKESIRIRLSLELTVSVSYRVFTDSTLEYFSEGSLAKSCIEHLDMDIFCLMCEVDILWPESYRTPQA